MSATFDDGAAYAAHRPSYPTALPGLLAGIVDKHDLAVDVGCGTGQLTVPLARYFRAAIGVDPSASQIAAAKPAPNVSYAVGSAERLPVTDRADLITVAQAAHWIDDHGAFAAEVARIAAPGAAVAWVSYGTCHLEDRALDEFYQDFYAGEFHRFWDPRRRHVENQLRDLPFPWAPIALTCPPIVRRMGVDDFISYLGTWSAVAEARRQGKIDEFEEFAEGLRARWSGEHLVTWPVTVRAGRVG